MSIATTLHRHLPLASRQRALPAIGFEVTTPGELEVTPITEGPSVMRCCERRNGRTIELEISVFGAALIIDRDGILREKAHVVATDAAPGAYLAGTVAISLPGASGFRADATFTRGAATLPYVYVFAIASHDLGVDGGVLVTLHCATPEWTAAQVMLRSLRILTRHGVAPAANDDAEAPPMLPIVEVGGRG